MPEALRMLNEIFLILNCFSLKLCWIGCQLCDVILYVRFVI